MYFKAKDSLMYDGLKSNDIRWNFEKFLIDGSGVPVIRFNSEYLPHDIEPDIQDLLT